ncbi:MAG: hypothetical protein H9W81_07850 [Enterococcus sp.]|nr:hypothetical protein [Enterococcus sp.]
MNKSYEHSIDKIEGKSRLDVENMVEQSLDMALVTCMNISEDGDISLRIVDQYTDKAETYVLSEGDEIVREAYGHGFEVIN